MASGGDQATPATLMSRILGSIKHNLVIGDKCQDASAFLSGMVFCYQNCSDLLWEKILNDREKLLKFEAEGREFEKFLRSLEQFVGTVKVQNNFW